MQLPFSVGVVTSYSQWGFGLGGLLGSVSLVSVSISLVGVGRPLSVGVGLSWGSAHLGSLWAWQPSPLGEDSLL